MMKKFILYIIVLLTLPIQGQWIKEKGKGYLKLGSWSLLADQHFTDQGKVDSNATRGLFIGSLYGEFGLGKNLNLISYIPFFVKNYQFAQVSATRVDKVYEKRQENNGFGDINIGVEYGFPTKNNWNFSATLYLGIPTGESEAGIDGSYQTGDGEFNQLIQFNS